MKKVLRIFGFVVSIIILAIIGGAAFIHFSGIPSYENKAPKNYQVTLDSASIEEGARMASLMCVNCHKSEDGKLGGAFMPDTKEFGKIFSSNITQHPDHGITDYTDGELAFLLRTGIRKDGQYAPPWMPKFPHLSDNDLNSIIAFLRSDHPLVQPSDNVPPLTQPSFLAKLLTRVAFSPLPYPEEAIPDPDVNDKIAFGKYISTAKFDCYSCHSADFKTIDPMVPESSGGYFGGGNPLLDMEGNIVLSSNLTMDEETGLGKWTEAAFIKAVKYGIRPNGRQTLGYPMVPHTQMTDDEASAIWAYLKTLPKIRNEKLLQTNQTLSSN